MLKKMDVQTLPKKKTISKGKMKKSIKNVLYRPDAVRWPQTSENDSLELETALSTYRVDIPVFKKPHWNELKHIEKEKRPKAPPIPKVEGLIFGISEGLTALENRQCWAVIIEASVVPRTIVQPVIEACVQDNIPVVCLAGLRKISLNHFGIPTSCLCIKNEQLPDLKNQILAISNKFNKPIKLEQNKKIVEPMEVDTAIENQNDTNISKNEFSYLHRSDKRTRVFIPSDAKEVAKNDFSGQNFISFSNNQESESNSKEFMKMTVKKILGNANRVKRKKN
ncbi:uncharacterized protein LOC115440211 [Manduca sexta]|uniref:Ribosomal protein L7Ae/L30e/S12e/Gadd45 domain-containing protein n=1 Tax=Manduca sexta TaxID=7130 RepID=A0A921YT49_MANSE|nr:uncharacterized protein LOC115440211 [Manduca sexta]KAG6445077.1 hypothetical protein O3G_MSEX003750 [Manduca sexta]